MSPKLDHVAIVVRNLEEAIPYYIHELGMALVYEEEQAVAGVRAAYIDAGNALLQLLQPVRPGPIQEFLDEHGEGLHHICLAVTDIPETLNQLTNEAGTPVSIGGWGRRTCFLRHVPEGVRIELTEVELAR